MMPSSYGINTAPAVQSARPTARWAGPSPRMRPCLQAVQGRRAALSAWLCGLSAAVGFASAPRARAQARSSKAVLRENSDLSVAFPIWHGGEPTRAATEELLQASGGKAPAGAEAEWAGLWRVSYAPHIRTLGSLALTQLDVYYDIAAPKPGTSPEIRSFVRFEAWLTEDVGSRSSGPRIRNVKISSLHA